jgi:hypothetical protein
MSEAKRCRCSYFVLLTPETGKKRKTAVLNLGHKIDYSVLVLDMSQSGYLHLVLKTRAQKLDHQINTKIKTPLLPWTLFYDF